MMPLADIVALSTSVSNHWSSRSTALMVMSCTRLCCEARGRAWKRRSHAEQAAHADDVVAEGVGRDHGQDRLDEARHVRHRLRVLVVGFRVHGRVAVDLAPGARVVVHPPEVVPVRHRRERAVEGQDLEAVPGQVQLADDLGPQQRDDVGADRELEAREHLLGDGGAAEHVAALEHEHLLARAREVGRGDEPVVPAADDDRVVFAAHGSAHSSGALYLRQTYDGPFNAENAEIRRERRERTDRR